MESRDLAGAGHGFTAIFLSEIRLAQAAEIPLHVHPIEEVFVVLEGSMTFRLGEETFEAGPNSTIRIPPNTPHGVRNGWPEPARAYTAAPWNNATFYTEVTTYLEGRPR